MPTRRLLACCLSALLAVSLSACQTARPVNAAPASAPSVASSHASPAAPHYIDAATFDYLAVLPPPPAEGSPFAFAEAELIRAVQADTSAFAHRRAVRVESEDTVWEFATVLGPSFNPDRCPRIAALFRVAESDAGAVKNRAKDHFKRNRPPTNPLPPTNPPSTLDWSYPSGHCTRAFLRARLLAAVAPDQADELIQEARAMALNRMIAGRHYPTDVAGGIALGDAVARAMLDGTAMTPDLANAKADWDAVRAGHAR